MRNLLLVLLLAGAARPQMLTFAEGVTSGALAVRSVHESNPLGAVTTVLTDAELLVPELTNRTAQGALRADRARLLVRAGTTRVELPGNARLLRYRLRGGERWGHLLVRDAGARVVLELPGIGASGRDDPFTDRFGIAPDGRHAAFLTRANALWIARLDGQSFTSTGTPARLMAPAGTIEPLSLSVGRTVLFFATADVKVWRCALADGGSPQNATPPAAATAILKDQLAPSGDGSAVALLIGPKEQQQIWLLRESGAAVLLAPPPSKYEEPGYLPETSGGPRMLLNDDASRLLYVDASTRDEIHLLDTSGATPPVHLTSDVNFQPYIGIGIFPVFIAKELTIAIGDPIGLDVYKASTGQPLVTNLTKSGGNVTMPFGAGALQPNGAFGTGFGVVLATERTAQGTTRLRVIDPATSQSVVIGEAMRAPPELGASFDAAPDVLAAMHSGDWLIGGITGVPLAIAPPGVLLSHSARTADGVATLFRVSLAPGPQALAFLIRGGPLLALPPEGAITGFALTSGSGLLWNGSALRYVAPGVTATLASTSPLRVILSGAGA